VSRRIGWCAWMGRMVSGVLVVTQDRIHVDVQFRKELGCQQAGLVMAGRARAARRAPPGLSLNQTRR
jgi:hypothetical protein